MELLWRTEYEAGRSKVLSPSPNHYKLRTELMLSMTAKQFFDALQEKPLSSILPEKVENGEIIEIDDGLRFYYFYILNCAIIVPLPYFTLSKGDKQ